jgi:hypothetical protein
MVDAQRAWTIPGNHQLDGTCGSTSPAGWLCWLSSATTSPETRFGTRPQVFLSGYLRGGQIYLANLAMLAVTRLWIAHQNRNLWPDGICVSIDDLEVLERFTLG